MIFFNWSDHMMILSGWPNYSMIWLSLTESIDNLSLHELAYTGRITTFDDLTLTRRDADLPNCLIIWPFCTIYFHFHFFEPSEISSIFIIMSRCRIIYLRTFHFEVLQPVNRYRSYLGSYDVPRWIRYDQYAIKNIFWWIFPFNNFVTFS